MRSRRSLERGTQNLGHRASHQTTQNLSDHDATMPPDRFFSASGPSIACGISARANSCANSHNKTLRVAQQREQVVAGHPRRSRLSSTSSIFLMKRQRNAQSVSHQKSDVLNQRRSLFREELSQIGHFPVNTGKCVRVRGLGHQRVGKRPSA